MAIQSYNEKVGSIRSMLEANEEKIAEIMPKHVTVKRLCKTALLAINKSPKLLDCDRTSLMQALMTAGELGLDVSGTLGAAYLIPYGKQCTLQIGYRGLLQLARRSGAISSIEAHCVYEHDTFNVEFGLDAKLEHRPNYKGDRGAMVMVYAIARMKDGTTQFDVMTKADVDKIKNKSKAGRSGPWVDFYDEMAKKTITKRLCKYLPLSPELEKATIAEAESEVGIGPLVDVEDLTAQASQSDAIMDKIAPDPETDKRRAEEIAKLREADDDLPHFDDVQP